MTPIRVLLLDVMGTLVREPFYEDVPSFFGLTLEELRRAKHPTIWIDFERGTIDEQTYLENFFLDRRPIDGDAFKRMMHRSYALLDGIPELLEELKARGVPMFAFSNYSPWYTLIEDKVQLSRWLEWRFVSCRTGRRKPEPESFLEAAAALQRSPEECLLVDDRPVNCDAARALGMPAVHATGAASLRAGLIERGLL